MFTKIRKFVCILNFYAFENISAVFILTVSEASVFLSVHG